MYMYTYNIFISSLMAKLSHYIKCIILRAKCKIYSYMQLIAIRKFVGIFSYTFCKNKKIK